MTFEQMRLVFVVYTSALLPLFILPYLWRRALIPAWSLRVYIGSFLACALGWELWFTYGWVAGDPVVVRRASSNPSKQDGRRTPTARSSGAPLGSANAVWCSISSRQRIASG